MSVKHRWCHIRTIDPQSIHPERIRKEDRILTCALDYSGIELPVRASQYPGIERQCNGNFNVFGYNCGNIYPIYVSKRNNEKFVATIVILL